MKYSHKIKLLLRILFFTFSFFSTNSLASEYFLIPGYVKAGSRDGGEITLSMNESNFGDYEGVGIVVGGWAGPEKERSVELQMHTQGHVVFEASAGAGVYRSKSSQGVQATLSLQYFTPFIIFAREQIQTSPVVVAKKPQFGLMFKIPIPLFGARL